MFHIDNTPTQESHPLTTATFCSKTQVFVSIFATRMVLSAQELLAIEKKGNRWHGQQEDRDHAGRAAVDDEAVVVPLKDTAQKHVI